MSLFFRAKTRESHDRSHLVRRSCIILGQFFNLSLLILSFLLSVLFNFFFLWIIEITNYIVNEKNAQSTILKEKTNLLLQLFYSLFQIIIFLFFLELLFILCKSRFNLLQCGPFYLHGHAQITLI